MGLTTEESVFNFGQGKDVLAFVIASKPTSGLTQTRMKLSHRAISPGVRRHGVKQVIFI
jgi:hypothetical protein